MLLTEPIEPARLAAALAQADPQQLVPHVDDRATWEQVPEVWRQRWLAAGEAALATPWPQPTATAMLRYVRDGDREEYQRPHFLRTRILAHLTLAECVENRGRFIDPLLNAVWSTCEESWWGWPAHLHVFPDGRGLPDVEAPTVDLGVGERVALLAWIWQTLGSRFDAISPLIGSRLRLEVQRRLLHPCRTRHDFGWMGYNERPLNNWTPWCCANWLAGLFVFETDPSNQLLGVQRCLYGLRQYVLRHCPDGGCDEGNRYWVRAGASLFDAVTILHRATQGQLDFHDDPMFRRMARYIADVHIEGNQYANFADSPPLCRPAGALVHQYGQAVGDAGLARFGAWLHHQQQGETAGDWPDLGRTLRALPVLAALEQDHGAPVHAATAWYPSLELLTARQHADRPAGLFLAAKGGHNAESHNHNDVGQFIVHHDGRPLLVDAGVASYTRITFSAQRYTLWYMQSGWHNLPTLNGIEQAPGKQWAARQVQCEPGDPRVQLTLDLAGAYPAEARVESYQRQLALDRAAGCVTCVDAFRFAQPNNTLTWSLLTASTVELVSASEIRLLPRELPEGRCAGAAVLRLGGLLAEAGQWEIEVKPLDDAILRNCWGEQLTRLRWTAANVPAEGRLEMTLTPTA